MAIKSILGKNYTTYIIQQAKTNAAKARIDESCRYANKHIKEGKCNPNYKPS